MQINIDKKTGILLTIIGVLIGALFLIGAKEIFDREGNHRTNKMGGMHHSSSGGDITGSDAMFLQMMIPHHEQAIVMSDLALKISKTPQILDLAKQIKTAQNPEIMQMKNWLADSGFSEDPGHSMDGMGGMLSGAELSALNVETGTKFDILWLKGMTGHHDGAIHMTTMIRDASNPEIKAFGEKVIADQSAQIEQMREMIKRLS